MSAVSEAAGSGGTATPGPGAISERELQGDLIAAETAEPSQLVEAGTIAATTRRWRQQRLDLDITRLTEEQR
jgi:hypothetical protein